MEDIIKNAEGLLSYLESNVEILLEDIDPEGLMQAKLAIAKTGTGTGPGKGEEEVEGDEDGVKRDGRKGQIV